MSDEPSDDAKALDPRQGFFYAFGNVAGGIYNGFNLAVLSIYLSGITGPLLQGYLSNTKTMEGTIIQPIVGRLSDRSTSRFGRRRPFIGIFAPISVVFLLLIPYLHGASGGLRVPLIAGSIILFSIAANIAADPFGTLMIDITPERQRSRFNAILSIVTIVAQVLFVLFAAIVSIKKNNTPVQIFWVAGGIMLICYALVFFGVREPPAARLAAAKEERVPPGRYVADLRRFKQAQKLLLSYFFLWTGLNPLQVYLGPFVIHDFHASKAKAYFILIALFIFIAIFAYPWGLLAKRFGYRETITAGTVLMILAAIMGLLVRSYALLFIVAGVAGAGFSATTVLNYPYLSTLVPGSKMGVFTGLQTAFTSVGVVVSTGIAALLIAHFDYRSIFAVQAVMMVIDLAILWRVKETIAAQEVATVVAHEPLLAGIQA